MKPLTALHSFLLSILATLGLYDPSNFDDTANPPATELVQSTTHSKEEIIDQNLYQGDTEIKPEDLDRTKMLSPAFCGEHQAALFAAIKARNHLEIEKAIKAGADINKPTNCWRPLDEAIEDAITGKHEYIIEYLFYNGARVSQEQIDRVLFKKLAISTNVTEDPKKMEYTLGPVTSKAELMTQIDTINQRLENDKKQCEIIADLLTMELHRQQKNK